jgi:hypothetical protein
MWHVEELILIDFDDCSSDFWAGFGMHRLETPIEIIERSMFVVCRWVEQSIDNGRKRAGKVACREGEASRAEGRGTWQAPARCRYYGCQPLLIF